MFLRWFIDVWREFYGCYTQDNILNVNTLILKEYKLYNALSSLT